MKYTFNNIDKLVNRWLKIKLYKANDKDYTKSYLLGDIELIDNFFANKDSIIQTTQFKSVYHNYLIGNTIHINNLFQNDTAIVGLLTPNQKQGLITQGLIVQFEIKYEIQDRSLVREIFIAYRNAIFLHELLKKLRQKETIQPIILDVEIMKKISKLIKYEPNDNPNISKEPENPYSSIFINGYAYQMFLELKLLTVSKKTQVADFSFIFHSLKKCGFIVEDTKHRTFIKFLNTKCGADISATKLPFKKQLYKESVFAATVNKYNNLIESIS